MSMALLSDDVHWSLMQFLTGKDAVKASIALPWRDLLDCFAVFSRAEFGAPEASTRDAYRRLASGAVRFGDWSCGPQREHGLEDRVAQPQLFCGEKTLYAYGGWSNTGPQTDLHSVSIDAVDQAARGQQMKFKLVQARGDPVGRAGCQTLTPLWRLGRRGVPGLDEPSTEHIRSLATDYTPTLRLVVAFGGGQGGYRHEHNEWRVGLLDDAVYKPTVQWLVPRPETSMDSQPTARCAHSATYIPPRFAPRFTEGCVVVFGGHTDNARRSMNTIDVLDVATWRWKTGLGGNGAPSARHGHTANLVETGNRCGFLVVVGGGTGNVLEDPRFCTDVADAHALDLGFGFFADANQETLKWRSWRLEGPSSGCYTPGRHHTAPPTHDGKLVLYGGAGRTAGRMAILDARAMLTGEGTTMVLDAPEFAPGERPRDRKMHGSCCLLPRAPLVVVYGGWDQGPHFDDLWILAMASEAKDIEPYCNNTGARSRRAPQSHEELEETEDALPASSDFESDSDDDSILSL